LTTIAVNLIFFHWCFHRYVTKRPNG